MSDSNKNLLSEARYDALTDTLVITVSIHMSQFAAKSEKERLYVMGFTHLAMDAFKDTAVTLARKNYMYGNSSIAMTGQMGIAVRSFDKVARLLNIYKNAVDTSNTDESAVDSWKDLQGYSFIGHANSSGLWEDITQNAAFHGMSINNKAAQEAKQMRPGTMVEQHSNLKAERGFNVHGKYPEPE